MSSSEITLKDVALAAGVSIGTVSNVINGRGTVKVANRDRVLEVMRELDYIPDSMARSMKTRRSSLMGLILPSISNPFYPSLAKGVENELQARGYMVVLCNADRDHNKERAYIETLISNRVSGILVVKSELSDEHLARLSRKVNIVLIDSAKDYSGGLDMIETSNREGIAEAVAHLRSLGHERIAYISGDLKSRSDSERLAGFSQAMLDSGARVRPELVGQGDFSTESGYRMAKALLSSREPPSALCCGNDLMALGALEAARELKLPVPERLSLMGFDDIELCAYTSPALSTVRQPKYEQGALAARVLCDNIASGAASSGARHVIPTSLVLRGSTARRGA